MRYLVAYDIQDDRRRTRMAKRLERWGRRLQKSVFECELSPAELKRMWPAAESLLEQGDRLHLFRLCQECCQQARNVGGDLEAATEPVVIV